MTRSSSDDGSVDTTARLAAEAGATVIRSGNGPGKGQAMRTARRATDADVLARALLAGSPTLTATEGEYSRTQHSSSRLRPGCSGLLAEETFG